MSEKLQTHEVSQIRSGHHQQKGPPLTQKGPQPQTTMDNQEMLRILNIISPRKSPSKIYFQHESVFQKSQYFLISNYIIKLIQLYTQIAQNLSLKLKFQNLVINIIPTFSLGLLKVCSFSVGFYMGYKELSCIVLAFQGITKSL